MTWHWENKNHNVHWSLETQDMVWWLLHCCWCVLCWVMLRVILSFHIIQTLVTNVKCGFLLHPAMCLLKLLKSLIMKLWNVIVEHEQLWPDCDVCWEPSWDNQSQVMLYMKHNVNNSRPRLGHFLFRLLLLFLWEFSGTGVACSWWG